MKIHRFQIIADEVIESRQWRWTVLLWLRDPGAIADVALKSLIHYSTEEICVEEARKLLTELGIVVEFKPTRRKRK